MNIETALADLSARFDDFEERFEGIATLLYNYVDNSQPRTYVNTLGWQPLDVSGWRVSELTELIIANVGAWEKTLDSAPEGGNNC